MESILSILFSAENVRMLVMLVFGFSGYVLINSKMSRLESSLNKKIDGLDHKIDMVEASLNRRIDSVESSLNKNIDDLRHNDLAAINRRIDDLKHNDFAHLNSTIEALTFTLEKNGFLKREDKEYVDRRLTV